MDRGSAIDPIIHVKDGLRRLRYRVHRAAVGEGDTAPLLIPPLPQPFAVVADSMMSVVEAARNALAPESETKSHRARGILPIRDYLGLATNPSENFRAFTSAAYHAFKTFALRLGAREVLISELALERARRAFVEGLRARPGAGTPDSELIGQCAAFIVALAKARPIKRINFEDRGGVRAPHFADDPNVFVSCAIGLSAYIAATGDPSKKYDPTGAFTTAEAAIETHFRQLANALLAPNAVAAMEAEFSMIASFL